MNKRDFDHIDKLAQDAFKDFEVDYSPQDWFEFEEKLDAEIQIDQQAADAFENFSVSHEAADWGAFEQILEKETEKKRRFYPFALGLKGAEMGTIALCLFTFFNFYSSNSNQTNDNNSTLNSTTIHATAHSDSDKETVSEVFTLADADKHSSLDFTKSKSSTTSSNAEAISDNKQDDSNNNGYLADKKVPSVEKNVINNTKLPSKKKNGIATKGNIGINDIKGLLSKSEKAVSNSNNNILNGNNRGQGNLDDNLSKIAVPENTKTKEGTRLDENASTIIDVAKVNELLLSEKMLSAISLENNQIENEIVEPAFELKSVNQDKQFIRRIHLGGTASVDANIANSMGSTGIGYGAGFFMDIDLTKKFFVKTGLLVSYKKYLINQTYITDKSNIDGNIYEVEESKNTNLVVLRIPVDLNYVFFENEKWRAFVSAGVSANVVTNRFYDGTQQTEGSNGFLINTAINSEGLERGSMEGGALDNNFYLSVGGGIGLERQLGENISLYILPSYRQALLPIGKNKDRIGTFSFNVGVKTTIK